MNCLKVAKQLSFQVESLNESFKLEIYLKIRLKT